MQGHDLHSRTRGGLGRFGGLMSVLFIGLGLLLIGLAYDGASEQTFVQGQLPYLISGGLLGVSLIGIGAALMVMQGYREERARLEAKLDQLIVAVQRGGGIGPSGASALTPGDLAGLVVAGSASYHVPGCRLVDGREEVEYLTRDEAKARYLQPCRVCKPEPSEAPV